MMISHTISKYEMRSNENIENPKQMILFCISISLILEILSPANISSYRIKDIPNYYSQDF